jgi:hypothetical protein
MLPTYKDLITELTVLYDRDAERFRRFYNAVYMLISGLPAGNTLHINQHCCKEDTGLFIKIAAILIVDENRKKGTWDDWLEFFDDDYMTIRRARKFPPPPRPLISSWYKI